jgi:phosphoserine phosphatase
VVGRLDEATAEPLNPLSVEELLERLASELAHADKQLLAFDADGTLWAGDVGVDVLKLAVDEDRLRAEAQPALTQLAETYGVAASASAAGTAKNLFDAYLDGRVPEREVCGAMTWCYAGFTREELWALADEAFAREGLAERLRTELMPIFEFARRHALELAVVSASPELIVQRAVMHWNISPENVVGARSELARDRIVARLAEPVPYAQDKPLTLARRMPDYRLLASFGDSKFDLELLRAAKIGVAVHPKPALRDELPHNPSLWTLAA